MTDQLYLLSSLIHRWGWQNSWSIQACMIKITFDIKPWSERQKQLIKKFSEFDSENEYSNQAQDYFFLHYLEILRLTHAYCFGKTVWNIKFVSQHSKQYVVGLDPMTQLPDFSYYNISYSHMKQCVSVFLQVTVILSCYCFIHT